MGEPRPRTKSLRHPQSPCAFFDYVVIYFRFPNKFNKKVIFEKSGSMEFVSCEDVPMRTIFHKFSPH